MRTALEVACVGAQTHWVEEHQSLAPVYCPGNRFHSGPRNTSLRLVRGRREPADGVRAWRQQCLILASILNGTLRSNGCGGVMVAMRHGLLRRGRRRVAEGWLLLMGACLRSFTVCDCVVISVCLHIWQLLSVVGK